MVKSGKQITDKTAEEVPQWLESMPERLDGFTDVNLDGLWDGIEKSLPMEKAVVPIGRRPAVRWTVASVSAAAAAVALLLLLRPSPNTPSAPSSTLADISDPSEMTYSESLPETVPQSSVESPVPYKVAMARPVVPEETDNTDITPENRQEPAVQISHQNAGSDNPQPEKDASTEPAGQSREQNRTTPSSQPFRKSLDELEQEFDVRSDKGKSTKVRLALSASGLHSSSQMNVAAPAAAPAMPLSDGGTVLMCSLSSVPKNALPVITVREKQTSDYSWKVSSSVGAWIGWSPWQNLGLSLSSGVMLTRLDGRDAYDLVHQSASYVGVPLRVGYEILGGDNYSVSASIGGRLDMCISQPELSHIGKFQSSAYVGVNADYMFSRTFGLRAGLGADIYLPTGDNTDLMPFRKATPVASASVGVIVNL